MTKQTKSAVHSKGAEAKAKSPEAKTDKKNIEAAAQKITYERVMKWVYPEGCISAKDRKVFRQKMRGQIRRLEAHALKAKNEKEKIDLTKQAVKLRKEALLVPESAV